MGPILHPVAFTAPETASIIAASGASLDLFTLLGMVFVLVGIGGSFILVGEKRADTGTEQAPAPAHTARAPEPAASVSQRLSQPETAPAPEPVVAQAAPEPKPVPDPASDGLDALRAHSAAIAAAEDDDEDVDDMATVVFRHNPALDQE